MPSGILLPDERTALEEKLAGLVVMSPANLLATLGAHMTEIEAVQPPKLYAQRIIRYCEQSAWAEDPALIIKLLSLWKVEQKFADAIERLIKAGPTKYYNNGNPWEAFAVGPGLPFFGRPETRTGMSLFIEALVDGYDDPLGKRVLIVNGPRESGKTFTQKFVDYVTAIYERLQFKAAYIDYKSFVTTSFGAKELAESILNIIKPNWQVASKLPDLDVEQPARWRIQVAKFLATQIASTKEKWFIILDRFTDGVPAETTELIQLLADVATGARFAEESKDLIRLILLGFNDTIDNFENRVVLEKITPLTRVELEHYFKEYITLNKINIPVNDGASIDYLVNKVLQKDPGEQVPGRTKLLADETLKVAQELETIN